MEFRDVSAFAHGLTSAYAPKGVAKYVILIAGMMVAGSSMRKGA